MPSRFLFVTLEAGGNVPPVLGLAARLVRRGHRVRVLSEPCLESAATAYGLDFVPFGRHFTRTDRTLDIFEDWKPKGLSDPIFDNVVFGPIPIVAEETRAALEAEPADVLVGDLMMPGCLLAAEALGIPRVVLCHFPEMFPGPNRPPGGMGLRPGTGPVGRLRDRLATALFRWGVDRYLPALNRARSTFELPPLAHTVDLFDTADLRLIQTTRSFDFPLDPAPRNVVYGGPILDDPDWVPAWKSLWQGDDPRRLVLVSLSSTFQNQRGVLERVIASFSGRELRGLVTLGPAMAGEPALEAPENVAVVAGASHAAVLPHVAAVVTHAGHGTVMRALAHGVPLVCLPMGRDQGDNAARVVHHGAGLALRRSSSPSRIARAIDRVLDEPRFRESAVRLQRRILADAQADIGVAELERLAGSTPAPRQGEPAPEPLAVGAGSGQ